MPELCVGESNVSSYEFMDPFSTDRKTRYIHFNSSDSLEKAALLSRYSRSQKSMLDLIDTEFKDPNRAPSFINKLINSYGDDSIAELTSETIGIEGLSILAASKLTDQRIGISFIEKSTRYVPFSVEQFYVPAKIYEYGLVDEYKDLCGLSFRAFNKIYNELERTYEERYPINTYSFYNSSEKRDTRFENLTLESDIKSAERAYNRSVKDKAFDIAGYSWLTSLKTNIGFNANCRALEYLISKGKQSRLEELSNISSNLYDILERYIKPFIVRTNNIPRSSHNPFAIYSDEPSLTSVYKHNIATWARSEKKPIAEIYDEELEYDEEEEEESHILPTKRIMAKTLLDQLMPNQVRFKENIVNTIQTDSKLFEPEVGIISYIEENSCIDTLCSAILYENDEILLEYDQKNISNIDPTLRISTLDTSKIKAGLLYDIINNHKTMKELYTSQHDREHISENILTFDIIQDYWNSNRGVNDTPVYQNYTDNKVFTFTKDQHFIINRYIGERKTRRNKLGRAFELISYLYEISSSFRIMREFKRHRLINAIYPQLITSRDSYDSYIFPLDIIKDKILFDSYKHLISESFKLYSKIIDKHKDYVTAQYCLPLSVRCNYIASINLRELDYLLSLRTTPQAHPEFRQIAKEMYKVLMIIHPNLAKLLKFVDLKNYSLGRLKSEYNSNLKKLKLEEKK